MIVVAIIALLAVFTIPTLLKLRIQTNESAVQKALRTIAKAEATYRIANPSYGTLAQLGAPATKNGYHFATTDITPETFHAYAIALKPNVTGRRSFCITEDGVVRDDPAGSRPVNRAACLAAPFVSTSP
jgi:type II secretory pathway pseudopilin PulG